MENLLELSLEQLTQLIEKEVNKKIENFGLDIAQFEFVSEQQFVEDSLKNGWNEEDARIAYANLILPASSTIDSAGFDFKTPYEICLEPNQSILIPTGIRCKMDKHWALILCPRSGHGTKYRVQLDNTIGVIDKDYYDAKNEGHIMAKITNDGKEEKVFSLKSGEKFIQGLFLYTGTAKNAVGTDIRIGGLGSTL